MKKLNMSNWPYFIRNVDSNYNEPLNSLDCLRIHLRLYKLHNEESNDKKLYLPDERMEIDLDSMEAKLEGMPNKKF